MVSQFTQPQQLAPPQAPSPSLSPAQWAQLVQLAQTQQQQQSASPQPAAPPSTSAYTSSGTMSTIDPALLQAQWLQLQQSHLAQSAIIPQYQQQYAHQYLPQGEFLDNHTIESLANHFKAANSAASAASEYIDYLQSFIAALGTEYSRLVNWSLDQNELIEKFLFNRDFAIEYARYAWLQTPVSDEFMTKLANTYLDIAESSPRGINANRNPEYTGNPNPQFTAAVVPQNAITPQPNLIPPLPSSNGNVTPYITMEQYLVAQQQGQVAQARAAALSNPAGLYGALFQ